MTIEIERRTLGEIRAVTEGGKTVLRGHAAVFDKPSADLGGFVEFVRRGAFDRALAGNPQIPALFHHDPRFVLGHTRSGTLRLALDAQGLAYEIDPPDTSFARDLLVSVGRGDVADASFAFRVPKGGDKWDFAKKPATRELIDVDLLDVTVTVRGAYPDADSSVARRTLETALAATAAPGAIARPIMPAWHRAAKGFEVRAAGDVAEVLLYDAIGGWWGVDAKDFATQIAAIKAPQINLRINSPGGDVFDGVAMATCLREHPANVEARVDGLAASAATIVAMGANKIAMAPGSFMMIHEVASGLWGGAADFRKEADLLDKIGGSVANTYATRTGQTADAMRAAMAAETWYTADEAVACKLADEVRGAPADHARAFDLSVFKNAPAALREAVSRVGAPPVSIAMMRRRLDLLAAD